MGVGWGGDGIYSLGETTVYNKLSSGELPKQVLDPSTRKRTVKETSLYNEKAIIKKSDRLTGAGYKAASKTTSFLHRY